MSDTFLAAVLERSFDLQNSSINNNIFSNFQFTLPSPVNVNNLSSNIHSFTSVNLPPPPPSPYQLEDRNGFKDINLQDVSELSNFGFNHNSSKSESDLDEDSNNKEKRKESQQCIIL